MRGHSGESACRVSSRTRCIRSAIRRAEIAERSLDVQYYFWQNEPTGTLLLDARLAAYRDVRVRILLDDKGTLSFAI